MLTTTPDAHDVMALRRCCEDGSLELRYQPEVDLATGAIVAMEALLHWHHPQRGLLSPAAFLELAQAGGEIVAIGSWELTQAAAEAVRWQSLAGAPRRLWLHMTVGQISAPGFVVQVAQVIQDAGLAPGALGLEISEGVDRRLDDNAVPLLVALRNAGVALAVDDLGNWLSTLGAIATLPVDAVKLGDRYVRHLGEDGANDATVAEVIDQAHARGMIVVAEGVHAWGEAARLTELGCDRAHGWLHASPQRADRARWLLQHGAGWRQSTEIPPPRS